MNRVTAWAIGCTVVLVVVLYGIWLELTRPIFLPLMFSRKNSRAA